MDERLPGPSSIMHPIRTYIGYLPMSDWMGPFFVTPVIESGYVRLQQHLDLLSCHLGVVRRWNVVWHPQGTYESNPLHELHVLEPPARRVTGMYTPGTQLHGACIYTHSCATCSLMKLNWVNVWAVGGLMGGGVWHVTHVQKSLMPRATEPASASYG